MSEPTAEATTDIASEPESFRATLGSAIGAIAAGMNGGFSPGEIAALRRVGQKSWGVPAYWRVVSRILESRGLVVSERDEKRWAVVLSALALLSGQHARGVSLGRALASAGVSELRVERLLRAHDDALLDLIRPLAHQLASKGTSFDQATLADLVISDGTKREDSVRRAIARDFYRAESAANV